MKTALNRLSYFLSVAISVLAIAASAGGLFIGNLYRDNAFVKSAWSANDIITLFVVVPLLLLSIYLSNKGSQRWKLIWIGLLGYMVYNFAFYLFGAAFNIFFLLYTALFSLSGFTLLHMLWQISAEPVNEQFPEKIPVKWISAYLMLMPVMLFIAELGMIIPFLTWGKLPETIQLTGNSTSVVFALDFSIIIPAFIASAILLWQRKNWGYILAVMMLVKGFTYGLVLCLGTALLAYSPTYSKWDPLMPLYVSLAVGGIVGCWLLLKNLKSS
jgi:hypothetical protein